MTGFWLVSYIVLWLLVLGAGLVILALAREVEALHKRLDMLPRLLRTARGALPTWEEAEAVSAHEASTVEEPVMTEA